MTFSFGYQIINLSTDDNTISAVENTIEELIRTLKKKKVREPLTRLYQTK